MNSTFHRLTLATSSTKKEKFTRNKAFSFNRISINKVTNVPKSQSYMSTRSCGYEHAARFLQGNSNITLKEHPNVNNVGGPFICYRYNGNYSLYNGNYSPKPETEVMTAVYGVIYNSFRYGQTISICKLEKDLGN